jgi:hypothetical protein
MRRDRGRRLVAGGIPERPVDRERGCDRVGIAAAPGIEVTRREREWIHGSSSWTARSADYRLGSGPGDAVGVRAPRCRGAPCAGSGVREQRCDLLGEQPDRFGVMSGQDEVPDAAIDQRPAVVADLLRRAGDDQPRDRPRGGQVVVR